MSRAELRYLRSRGECPNPGLGGFASRLPSRHKSIDAALMMSSLPISSSASFQPSDNHRTPVTNRDGNNNDDNDDISTTQEQTRTLRTDSMRQTRKGKKPSKAVSAPAALPTDPFHFELTETSASDGDATERIPRKRERRDPNHVRGSRSQFNKAGSN